MVKLTPSTTGVTKVTFALPAEEVAGCVSVVGDFNGWNPHAHPMRKRSNGTRSVAVDLPAESRFEFKYLAEDGTWLVDDGTGVVHNEFGAPNSVLTT